MSQHQAFRRVPVNPQIATKQETITFPAPTRGIILNENESYMQPGAALICDNWMPTMKGASIRGGTALWADLHAASPTTWNPSDKSAGITLSGGNLTYTGGGAARATNPLISGKVYWEVLINQYVESSGYWNVGFTDAATTYAQLQSTGVVNMVLLLNGNIAQGSGVTIGSAVGNGDRVCIAVDFGAKKSWFRKNGGNWNNSGSSDPAAGIGGISWILPVGPYYAAVSSSDAVTSFTANFGATAFSYAVPAGFTAGWVGTGTSRKPLISAFQYASGINHRMFFANANEVYDVTTTTPVLVKSGQLDGNYSTSQMANAAGDYLIAVNDAGDYPLRFDGTTWTTLNADQITGPAGSAVLHGKNLVHVCKYRNRWFFIELNSMNAWYLGINSIGGALSMIPLSGAATKGGKLLYCATWSLDAGDGIDDKLVFGTDLGEILVFTGSNPADAANWRQEGRYDMSPPMGKNATLQIGGDLLVACVDGILPTSGAITKSRAELELAAVTRSIKPMWRLEVIDKREWAWTMCKWDVRGMILVTWPGGKPGQQHCAAVNAATGAWARFTGLDATCFARLRDDAFFGTQTGQIMQMDITGADNGLPYVCTIVGGWEVFQSPSQTITWKQARASFSARSGEAFQPQLSGTTDYVIVLPPPPSAPPDPGVLDLWDQGLWDVMKWDADPPAKPVVRNTGWVSIGITGFSHALVVQVTMAQQAKPEVELISVAGTFERLAVTV